MIIIIIPNTDCVNDVQKVADKFFLIQSIVCLFVCLKAYSPANRTGSLQGFCFLNLSSRVKTVFDCIMIWDSIRFHYDMDMMVHITNAFF